MLVILSFALVLVATVLLVLGLLDGGLTLIYFSIGSSFAAAIVLVVAIRMARAAERGPVAPLGMGEPELVGAGVATSAGLGAGDTVAAAPAGGAPAASPPPEPEQDPPVVEPDPEWHAADRDEWSADDWDDGQEVEFPIADYDDLTSRQILPLLPQLYADELDVVEERERLTKARPEIIERLAELRGGPAETTLVATGPGASPVTGDPLADHVDQPAGGEGRPPAPVVAPETEQPAKRAPARKKAAAKKAAAKKKAGATRAPAKKRAAASKAPARKRSS